MTGHGPHAITLVPQAGTVRVWLGEQILAQTDRALALSEGMIAPVLYLPREDVRMDLAHRTERSTHCPFKGDASYYRFEVEGRVADSAAWSYESPIPQVEAIRDHLAFDPSRVDRIEILEAGS